MVYHVNWTQLRNVFAEAMDPLMRLRILHFRRLLRASNLHVAMIPIDFSLVHRSPAVSFHLQHAMVRLTLALGSNQLEN